MSAGIEFQLQRIANALEGKRVPQRFTDPAPVVGRSAATIARVRSYLEARLELHGQTVRRNHLLPGETGNQWQNRFSSACAAHEELQHVLEWLANPTPTDPAKETPAS